MLLTCDEMKHAEQEAFARGISAEALMEKAGRGMADMVRRFFSAPGLCVVFAGKGHNAGDAFVAARYLRLAGWKIAVRSAFPLESFAPLTKVKYEEASGEFLALDAMDEFRNVVILDGLLGLGAKGEIREPIASCIAEINALRRTKNAWVLAVDIPSGLDGDSGQPGAPCVEADLTATVAFAKTGLVADTAINHVGRLVLVPLRELTAQGGSDAWQISSPGILREWLPPRAFDTNKGQCGRIGLIAGSRGLTGAARLCSAAAVRAGGGLITLFVKEEIYPLLAESCEPEVMVKPVRNYRDVLEEKLDVLAVGPGLGRNAEILPVIRDFPKPMVVDADALNALAEDNVILRHCHGERLLTPHPGEMGRLFPQKERTRRRWLEDFLDEYPVTLLLKGARTLIGSRGGPGFYNTTGHPGMASGGMGDVLTGVCAALTAQTGSLMHAAVLGAWVCGRAAEIAIFEKNASAESLSATDVLDNLGAAFADLHAGEA